MATIKAIESRSVHQIQSGQVIIDLSSVVKELVENSLDAGATSIEVRFKNHGLDSIEVQDNGNGIATEDFETIALKHYTSKLSSFEDLTSLDTFGFRGEALSSLCALSNFHILTSRGEDDPIGRKLEFEVSGKLKGLSIIAAQKGTTIVVENLFYNLPVRKKELEKNAKREYTKSLNRLYAYACISTGVRFSVSHQVSKGKKTVAFSTNSNATTRENIANVFGVKMLSAMTKLDLALRLKPSEMVMSVDNDSKEVLVQGHISRPVFGEGRQAPDRQMFFVNSRPCNLPQIAKAINEVYKSFNVSQSPFVFANLVMETNAYDVNVSPDKRTILLHDQGNLLDELKAALVELFEKTDHTVPQSTLSNTRSSTYKPLIISREVSTAETEVSVHSERSHEESNAGNGSDDKEPTPVPESHMAKKNTMSLIERWVGHGLKDRDKSPMTYKPTVESRQRLGQAMRAERRTNCISEANSYTSHMVEAPSNPQENSRSPSISSASSPPVHINASVNGDITSAQEEGSQLSDSEPGSAKRVIVRSGLPVFSTLPRTALIGPIESALNTMRPKRAPLQTAEITVGTQTTKTVIGSGSPYKRRRLDSSDDEGLSELYQMPASRGALARFAPSESSMLVDPASVPLLTPVVFVNGASADGDSPSEAEDANSQISGDGDNEGGEDADYIDERENKIRANEKIAQLIHEAEIAAARPTEENVRRASRVLKNGGNRKESTLQLSVSMNIAIDKIKKQALDSLSTCGPTHDRQAMNQDVISKSRNQFEDKGAESRLSLTVSKDDFERMNVIGQFNLGFVLAVRPARTAEDEAELFIIDQHAADEKFNYEHLQRTVTLQSQRLVHAKVLEVTAVEEEILSHHFEALKANGFEIEIDHDHANDSGRRICRLVSLPMSKEKTFDLSDLEELLHLLSETPSGSSEIPRPRKVQRMLAMKACRSSIMVGKTLSVQQMQRVVRHMGEMDKPWNCPHGRPTMRHLAGLGAWSSWEEGHSLDLYDKRDDTSTVARERGGTDWQSWLAKQT